MKKHYHFIGIGGIGMGALASLMLDKGYPVSGSDIKENALIQQLRKKGAKVTIGHEAKNVNGAQRVVFSSAVQQDNPEIKAAHQKQLSILQRAELLAELMNDYIGVTVAGAHGKTTTTSMVSTLLVQAGLHPTTAVGGIVNGTSSNARLGEGQYFVAELDESDGTFLKFSPFYSIITNIDFEHVDFYSSWENILKAYKQFILKTNEKGLIIACGEDERLLKLLKESRRVFKTYGLSKQCDVYAENIVMDGFFCKFDCVGDEKKLGTITLRIPGKHNILNALACVILGQSLAVDFKIIQKTLEEFRGVQRRFQVKGQVNDITVVDDYGHHPTEITATLTAALSVKAMIAASRPEFKNNRLIVAFQPHRYTRMKFLWEEFAKSLSLSDHLIVTDIYAASEKPIDGVTSENFCREMESLGGKRAIYFKKDKMVEHLRDVARPGDLIITLGAGDITKISDELVVALEKHFSKLS